MASPSESPPHKTQRTRSNLADQEVADLTQTLDETLLEPETEMQQDAGIPIKELRRKSGRRVRIQEPDPTPTETKLDSDNPPPQEEQTPGWAGDSGGTGDNQEAPTQQEPPPTNQVEPLAGGTLPDPDLDEVMEPEEPVTGPTPKEAAELTAGTSSRGNAPLDLSQVATPLRASGRRVAKWRVSAQPDRARPAHCQRCKEQLHPGTLRLHSAANRGVANRFWHLGCLDATLPPAAALEGYPQLSTDQQEDLRAGLSGVTLPLSQEAPYPTDARRGDDPRLCETDERGNEARRCENNEATRDARHCEATPDTDRTDRNGPAADGPTRPCESGAPMEVSGEPVDPPHDGPSRDLPLDEPTDDEGATPREDNHHEVFPHLEWWDECPWDDILHCPAVTTAMVPRGIQHALAEYKARLCVLLGDARREENALKEERLWKVLLASDAFLFCPGGDSEGATRSAQLSRRLADAEEGNWGSLWATACEEGGGRARGSNDKERTVARVSGLLQAGEVSRAAAAVWGGASTVSATAVEETFRGSQPRHGPPLPTGIQDAPWTDELVGALADKVAKSFGRFPRRSGAGPGGGRYEHWECLAKDATHAKTVARTLVRLVYGDVPPSVLRAFLSARLVGIPKSNGGVRVLGSGNVLRRLLGRVLVKEFLNSIKAAVGRMQFGVQADGTGKLHRLLTTAASVREGVVVVAVDVKEAFTRLHRSAALRAVAQHAPDLLPVAKALLAKDSHHVAPDPNGGPSQTVVQTVGLDQGCPWSPGLYSVTVAEPLQRVDSELKSLDAHAFVCAFYDDTYLVGTPRATEAGLAKLQQVLAEVGLELNVAKTQVWSPNTELVLPRTLARYRVEQLKCVGAMVPYARADREDPEREDWRDVPIEHAFVCQDLEEFKARQGKYLNALLELHEEGLQAAHVLVLARTWSQGAYVHLLRTLMVSQQTAEDLDKGLADFLEKVLGTELNESQRDQLFLKVADGGLGMGSAVRRAVPAWTAAWEGGLHDLSQALGVESWTEFALLCPQWKQAAAQQDLKLAELTGKPLSPTRWEDAFERPQLKTQRVHSRAAADSHQKTWFAALPPEDQDRTHLASGYGAGAFLTPPEGEPPVDDKYFKVAVRRRLRCPTLVPQQSLTCCHRSRDGRPCGAVLPADNGHHAVCCSRGGGTVARHGAVRDTLAAWLRDDLGLSVHTEQEVPRWHTARERAVLDLVYAGPAANTVKMDVSVVDGATTHRGVRQAKWCLARRERTKHHRYPGPGLVPFVLDTRGRWGHEAMAWLRAVARTVPQDLRADAMARCRYKVSVALQRGVADQVWSACWCHDRTRHRAT